MPAMTIGFNYGQSPMRILPSATFGEIISPFGRGDKAIEKMDWERRWQAEWDRRNVED